VYHSTLGLRVIKKKRRVVPILLAIATGDDAMPSSGSGEGKFVSTLPLQYHAEGVGFRVQGLSSQFGVQGSMFGVYCLRFKVYGPWSRIKGLGSRVEGLGSRVKVVGCRVQGDV